MISSHIIYYTFMISSRSYPAQAAHPNMVNHTGREMAMQITQTTIKKGTDKHAYDMPRTFQPSTPSAISIPPFNNPKWQAMTGKLLENDLKTLSIHKKSDFICIHEVIREKLSLRRKRTCSALC